MHQNLVSWSIEKGARRQSSSAWLVDKHYIDGLPLACSCVTILVCSTLSGEKNPHNLVPKKPVLVIFFFSLALLNNFHDPTSFHLQLINYQFGVRWICMCSMTIKKLSPNLVLHAQFPSYFKRMSNCPKSTIYPFMSWAFCMLKLTSHNMLWNLLNFFRYITYNVKPECHVFWSSCFMVYSVGQHP